MPTNRLTPSSVLPAGIELPTYTPGEHAPGILHLGLGAFHRAHQAVYTDAALAATGGDWRITGVSLRSPAAADRLNPQQGRYSLLIRGNQAPALRVIGSIDRVEQAFEKQGLQRVLELLASPATRIVSLTITEKAYGIDRNSGAIDTTNPAIAHDLLQHQQAGNYTQLQSAIGLLVAGLRYRHEHHLQPFTVLCCDNLADNGKFLKAGVLSFAAGIDSKLAAWIERQVAFPSTMVDRITPASTPALVDEAAELLGTRDEAVIETEPFTQWVIEDQFPAGRPDWEAGGALFVEDVSPYEMMKLRMLNGAHSMLAYAGFMAGHCYVRDAMAEPTLSRLALQHMNLNAKTLPVLAGVNYADYAAALCERFANPAIAHELYQIAMDGTEKLPQRLFAPSLHAVQHKLPLATLTFTAAAWMRYCVGSTESGKVYELRDPRETEIKNLLANQDSSAESLFKSLVALPGLVPQALVDHQPWVNATVGHLGVMLQQGMQSAIEACARNTQ